MTETLPLDVTIPSDTSRGSEVQERILALLEQHQFSDHDLFGMRLALEEAIVNAIKHGNQLDPQKKVRIRCELQGDRVIVDVEDEGPGFDPADVPDPTDDENLEKASGRGLMLMRAFMSSVTYSPRGNAVRLEKVRTPQS